MCSPYETNTRVRSGDEPRYAQGSAPGVRPATADPKMLGTGGASQANLAIRSRRQMLDKMEEDAAK